MDPRLHQAVVDRLDADGSLHEDVVWLVLAACDGPDTLAQTLGGERSEGPAPAAVAEAAAPPAVYLRAIGVEGFRGVGPAARLELEPGPGLTLVVGRNGSGKSSFAEAVELCLTGANRRWADRSAVWRGGWRNLHHPDPSRVSAELVVDGLPGPVTVSRDWSPGAANVDGAAGAVHGHPTVGAIDGLGWTSALTAMRPFLSYNELARMFEVPSQLHDALAAILGLGDLVSVADLLRDERRAGEKALKAAKDGVAPLRARLDGMEDARAATCLAALSSSPWDLDAIELALAGAVDAGDPEGDLALLSALASVAPPESETTRRAARGRGSRRGRRRDRRGALDAARRDPPAGARAARARRRLRLPHVRRRAPRRGVAGLGRG